MQFIQIANVRFIDNFVIVPSWNMFAAATAAAASPLFTKQPVEDFRYRNTRQCLLTRRPIHRIIKRVRSTLGTYGRRTALGSYIYVGTHRLV